jgi:glycosyltransferase involved in cell wall biosynthesis
VPACDAAVVIAAYNHARFLPEAIASVLGQTATPAEVLVVDDGSTDETASVVARYAPRVAYRRQDNAGARAARNAGLDATSAPWVAFLDADDWWEPDALRLLLAAFDETTGIAAPAYLPVDAEGRRTGALWIKRTPGPFMTTEGLLTRDADVPGCVYRRAVFDRCGRFDATLRVAGDYEMFLRASTRFRIRFVPEAVLHKRAHGGNISAATIPRLTAHLACVRAFLAREPDWAQAHPGIARRGLAKALERLARAQAVAGAGEATATARQALRLTPLRAKLWWLALAPGLYARLRAR